MKSPPLLIMTALCMALSSQVTTVLATSDGDTTAASGLANGNTGVTSMTPNKIVLMLVGAAGAVLVLLIIARIVIETRLKDDFNFEAYENQHIGHNQAPQPGHGNMGQHYPQPQQGYTNQHQQYPQQQHGYSGQHPGDLRPRPPPPRPGQQQYGQQGYQNY